jgi:hypothetical protein
MIKTLKNLEIEGNFFTLMLGVMKNIELKSYFMVKRLNNFTLNQEQDKDVFCCHF